MPMMTVVVVMIIHKISLSPFLHCFPMVLLRVPATLRVILPYRIASPSGDLSVTHVCRDASYLATVLRVGPGMLLCRRIALTCSVDADVICSIVSHHFVFGSIGPFHTGRTD